MSSFCEGQVHQLMNKLEADGFTANDITMLGQYPNLAEFLPILKGRATIVPIDKVPPKPPSSILRIDRGEYVHFPKWVREIKDGKLQNSGPTKFDLRQAERWLHDGQKDGKMISGKVIYEHLKSNKMLESCYGLAELISIEAKGINFFREHLKGLRVIGLKSMVFHYVQGVFIPSLSEFNGKLVLDWIWPDLPFGGNDMTLRFESSKLDL